MKIKHQKRLAGQILKCSKNKIKYDLSRIDDIKEAITRQDIKSLIKERAIIQKPTKGTSKFWARKKKKQKSKGKRKGHGSRKGKSTARTPKKREWINKIRAQRGLLSELKEREKITNKVYKNLYLKAKGGFFRNKRHIKLYIKEHDLLKK